MDPGAPGGPTLEARLTLGTLGILGMGGLLEIPAAAASKSSFLSDSNEGKPLNIRGLKFKCGGSPGMGPAGVEEAL